MRSEAGAVGLCNVRAAVGRWRWWLRLSVLTHPSLIPSEPAQRRIGPVSSVAQGFKHEWKEVGRLGRIVLG